MHLSVWEIMVMSLQEQVKHITITEDINGLVLPSVKKANLSIQVQLLEKPIITFLTLHIFIGVI